MRPKIQLVAAMAKDRTIGKGGKIPWHYTEDMRFFKVITMGTALVMGRKTFDTIGRALPGRDNIVVTHDPKALAAARNRSIKCGFSRRTLIPSITSFAVRLQYSFVNCVSFHRESPSVAQIASTEKPSVWTRFQVARSEFQSP